MANTDKFGIFNCVWFTKPQFLYLFKFHLVDVWSWNFLQRQVLDKITFDSFLRCFNSINANDFDSTATNSRYTCIKESVKLAVSYLSCVIRFTDCLSAVS